ncbi:MAG: hypothetical protein JL56_07135, partial [Desulfotomaculum sp. BICA1-6]
MRLRKIAFIVFLFLIFAFNQVNVVYAEQLIVTGKVSLPCYSDGNIGKYLKENANKLSLDSDANYLELKTSTDKLGNKHIRTQQEYLGLPIYGSEIIVHINISNQVNTVTGNHTVNTKNRAIKKGALISPGEAIAAAKKNVEYNSKSIVVKKLNRSITIQPTEKAELMWYEHKGQLNLAYVIDLNTVMPKPSAWKVFVDATNARVIDKYSNLKDWVHINGTGIGVKGDTKTLDLLDGQDGYYYMVDTTSNNSDQIGAIQTYQYRTETDDLEIMYDTDTYFSDNNQKTAVDAHYYHGLVLDYFKNKFSWLSYNGQGSTILPVVHFNLDGYENAGYYGNGFFVYADGDSNPYNSPELPPTNAWSAALDVIGHEYVHGVTEATCNLEYRDQSGALNESLSDIFGQVIERQIKSETDWKLGEEVFIDSENAFRDMADPTLYGQPAHINNYLYTLEDNGGVHTNSGITNKALYELATRIGDNKTLELCFYAMNNFFTTTTDFQGAANLLYLSAKSLYGAGSLECQAVFDSFNIVGIVVDTDGPTADSVTTSCG